MLDPIVVLMELPMPLVMIIGGTGGPPLVLADPRAPRADLDEALAQLTPPHAVR